MSSVFIHRVVLQNFRSIASCDLELGPLTFLVGVNGAGKSNFVDALRLISDSLNTSLDHALRERGGIQEVRRRSRGHPTHFSIEVEFQIPPSPTRDGPSASEHLHGKFSFEISAKPRGGFAVKRETCVLGDASYEVLEGRVAHCSSPVAPPASADRLYLVNAAGLPEFRPAFDALVHMGFYNISPNRIRELQGPDPGEVLARDGSNLASVTARLERSESGESKQRIVEYLSAVVPGVVGFDRKAVGHMEALEFRQAVEGGPDPWRFPANNMSDGTLRATAILVALFQSTPTAPIRLVGIEEPETALHPAAAGVLRECLFDASRTVQVLVTSHSAELLDDTRVSPDTVRAVIAESGRTTISVLDDASRDALKDGLYTAGELLRLNQLSPRRPAPRLEEGSRQATLFREDS